ncbi:MAG TPA: hypothetical protein VKB27_01180 [Gammaproteobacteria bacterium]|nr:hypothetical protein [Gammaproteobacteria bacterium]
MENYSRALVFLGLLLGWPTAGLADPFAGDFSGQFGGEEYELTLNAIGGDQYEGEITIGGVAVPMVARRFGDQLRGQAGVGDDSFEFSAELQGDFLLLRDHNGEVIQLSRQ